MRTFQTLPADLRNRPFTVAEASRLGLTRGVLAGSQLRAPYRGVRVPAHLPDTLQTDCAALALLLGGHQWAFSHATGAALCGLPLPRGLPARPPLHLTVATTGSLPRVAGARAHAGLERRRRRPRPDGLVVVHPADTWCDLVPVLSDTAAVVLGDAVARRWGGLAALRDAVRRRAGARGAVRMRRLLALVRERVDSPMETRTRLVLVRAGLPEPECGRPVHAADGGGWLSTPDLSWPRVRVALECDGDVHRTDRRQWRGDVARAEVMADHGWRVLVATAEDVLHQPERLVDRVANALRRRGMRW